MIHSNIMLINNHEVELYVNNQLVDFDENLDITFQKIIRNPEKLQTTNATYSYTFNLPITNTNAKIFNHANIPSKLNKFASVYQATLYSDGYNIFEGKLKITEIDSESFKCNMYQPKANTVESIFGESVMSEIDWHVPFDGLETVNEVNADLSTKYFFPLVSYGLFQKVNYNTESNAKLFTSKKLIDYTNRFYYNSFIPSLNLVELLKKLCQTKGYNLQGDILSDELINSIYLSNYISDEQNPLYNYGNPKLGKISLGWNHKSQYTVSSPSGAGRTGTQMRNQQYYTLNYPPEEYALRDRNSDVNNFTDVCFLNILQSCYDEFGEVSYVNNEAKLYHNGWIEIPANGYYQIKLSARFGIMDGQGNLTEIQLYDDNGNILENQTVTKSIQNMPVEIHLVRYNVDDGDADNAISHDLIYKGSYPNEAQSVPHPDESDVDTGSGRGDGSTSGGGTTNRPGEGSGRPGGGTSGGRNTGTTTSRISTLSTRASGTYYENGRGGYDRVNDYRNTGSTSGDRDAGNRYSNRSGNQNYEYNWRYTSYNSTGQSTNLVCVDTCNNSNFVCGFAQTEWLRGPAVLKDGLSWNSSYQDYNYDVLYNCDGYYITQDMEEFEKTNWNKNELPGAPNCSVTPVGTYLSQGYIYMTVKLNKGDMLGLYYVTRHYNSSANRGGYQYQVQSNGSLEIEAIAPEDTNRDLIKYDMDSLFDEELNLGNFCHDEQKMSDFINDIIKAFNLSFSIEGNTITLNKQKITESNGFIDLDNRVNNSEITIKNINFPSSLQINFTIDTEEEGFYQSVPEDKIELNNWKDYGDYGSEKLILTNNEESNDLTETLRLSYDWTTTFKLMDIYRYAHNGYSTTTNVEIPTIGKSEWYIENYKYEEMMKYDGRSMNQRMWFRESPMTNYRLPCNATYDEATEDDWYYVTIPSIEKTINGKNYDLSYKNHEGSLLKTFYNLDYDSSTNEVELKCFITPNEYKLLSQGSPVKFDSDLYDINEIQYNLNGDETSKLTIMKRI